MAKLIETVLNEAVLGFLALLSLFLMVTPAVFALTPAANETILAVEYAIIVLFAIEYLAGAALAGDKRRYVLNKWRIIDALIIIAALITLFPAGPEVLRNSPVLRLARLGRITLLGTRSGLALKAPPEAAAIPAGGRDDTPSVLALGAAGNRFEAVPWEAALSRIGSAEPDWLFIRGVGEQRLAEIARALAVPEKAVRGLYESSVPRFDRLERFNTLFVRYPLPMRRGERMRRTPVLLVGSGENVVVLSREQTDLEQRVEARLADVAADMPRMVRATAALLGAIVRAYTEVLEHLEIELLSIEADLPTLKDTAFLARTFDLRADILRVRSSLKHLRTGLRDQAEGDPAVALAGGGDAAVFRLLSNDVDDLYEGIEDLRDSLQALVDLRLNVSSFQMNRVMRLLALLTALALIPATAGGLLGMNLLDTPWPATLAQVAYGVAAGMALSLYIFAVKGWLR